MRLAATFSIGLNMKGKLEIERSFFISSLSNPVVLSSMVMVHRFQHNDITDSAIDLFIMVVISGRSRSTYFFKSQVGNGSKSEYFFRDLLGDYLLDINFRSWSKQFEYFYILFYIISAPMQILQALFEESEIILFLIIFY